MLFLTLAAATTFICANAHAVDGASVKCGLGGAPMRLVGVATPPPIAKCLPGEDCDLDPGIAARDRLATIIVNRDVVCLSPTTRARRSVRCFADGIDLSCAILAYRNIEDTGPPLNCARGGPTSRRTFDVRQDAKALMTLPPIWRWLPLYLLVMNLVTYLAFVVDHQRARTRINRVAKSHLMALIFFGGGLGAAVGHQRLIEMDGEQRFALWMFALIGLQIGGLAAMYALGYLSLGL